MFVGRSSGALPAMENVDLDGAFDITADLFRLFDESNDGAIVLKEMSKAIKADVETLQERMAEADADGNGFVTFPEFRAFSRLLRLPLLQLMLPLLLLHAHSFPLSSHLAAPLTRWCVLVLVSLQWAVSLPGRPSEPRCVIGNPAPTNAPHCPERPWSCQPSPRTRAGLLPASLCVTPGSGPSSAVPQLCPLGQTSHTHNTATSPPER
jgi:hypothetical protein